MAYEVNDQIEVIGNTRDIFGYLTGRVLQVLDNEKYLIRYTYLLNEDESAQLEEIVHDAHLRPIPYVVAVPQFKVTQFVNVWHNHIWMKGEIVQNFISYCSVRLEQDSSVLNFELENIRLYQEWADNTWIYFTLYGMKLGFHVEDEIEIIGSSTGLIGTYHPGVVKSVLKNKKYRVQYKHLNTEDQSCKLEEIVPERNLRPKPFEIIVPRYKVGHVVDVWSKSCWWTGTIVEDYTTYYGVSFDKYEGIWYYSPYKMRYNQQWKGNPWIYRRY